MLEKENGSCDESVSSTLSTNETHCEKDELRKSSLEQTTPKILIELVQNKNIEQVTHQLRQNIGYLQRIFLISFVTTIIWILDCQQTKQVFQYLPSEQIGFHMHTNSDYIKQHKLAISYFTFKEHKCYYPLSKSFWDGIIDKMNNVVKVDQRKYCLQGMVSGTAISAVEENLLTGYHIDFTSLHVEYQVINKTGSIINSFTADQTNQIEQKYKLEAVEQVKKRLMDKDNQKENVYGKIEWMFRKEFGRIVGEQRGYIERIRDWGRGVNNWVEGLFFSSVGTALGIALTKSIDRVDSVGLGDISLSKMTGLLPEQLSLPQLQLGRLQ